MIVMWNNIKIIVSFKILFGRLSLVFGGLTFILMVISCEKKAVSDISLGNESKVTFKVAGINNSNEGRLKLGSKGLIGTSGNNLNSATKSRKLKSNISFDAYSELTNIPSSFDDLGLNVNNKIASTSYMPSGRKFRIVILDLNNNIVETIQATVDKGISVDLEGGQQYKWYAYSFDDEQDIPAPSNEDQNIATPTDRDLLYAKSSSPFTVGLGPVSIEILFEHQLALLSIELDYHQLYATIPTNASDTNSVSEYLNWSFKSDPDFLYEGTFSLTTGEISNLRRYTANLTQRTKNHPSKENTKVAECYFVSPPPEETVSNSFTVSLNSLSVQFYNSNNSELIITNAVENTFSSVSNVKGHKYEASMRLRYYIPQKLILHVTGTDSEDDHKMALAAQPYARDLSAAWSAAPADNRPPFNMIKAARNYGELDNSIVYTEGFAHMRCSVDGQLDQKLTIPGQTPDIVILSVHYPMDANDITELINYLNNGGVVIMFTGYNGDPEDRIGVTNFMRALFNDNNINLVNNIYPNASLFEIDHFRMINDRITKGPFGDLRGKYWGVDFYNVIQMTGIPSSMVTSYSNPSADNNATSTEALSMFKHNSLDFFWIGNGGFLSGPGWNEIGGWNTKWGEEPFSTVLLPSYSNADPNFNYNFYPMPKKYGRDYYHKTRGYVGYSHGSYVHNAPFFANLMSWALYRSEFFGVNRNN